MPSRTQIVACFGRVVGGLAVGMVALAVPAANAAVIALDFEGIAPAYPFLVYPQVLNFYAGGVSSAGTAGTNHGVGFSTNALAICLNSLADTCSNGSRGGRGMPRSSQSALFFLDGSETFLNLPAGFTNAFSFNYVSRTQTGSASVFDGLDGSGNVLATVVLEPNAKGCPDYAAGFCPFQPIGGTFTGIGRSIGFGGVANQIAFDDVTFGSRQPGPVVPGPLAMGGGLVAWSQSRRLRRRLALRSAGRPG